MEHVVSGKRTEWEETTSGSVGFGFTLGVGGATKGPASYGEGGGDEPPGEKNLHAFLKTGYT